MQRKSDYFMQLLNCHSPEEVHQRVRSITSDLSDREHEVRAVILDIHTDVERLLKGLLYRVLLPIVWNGGDEAEFEKRREELVKMVTDLSFGIVHKLLRPALNSFPAPDLTSIQPINKLRNSVAHGDDVRAIEYKGRNPFEDADCLAELFFDWQGIAKEVHHFWERMLGDPQHRAKEDAKFREEHLP